MIVEYEADIRHQGAVVKGPSARYRQDKGMDFQIEITSEPKISRADFAEPLTVDRVSVTCVACKTGAGWRKGLLSDASKPAPTEVVGQGGNFTMFVNQPLGAATERDEFVAKVTQTLAINTGVPESDLKDRIFLFDANDISASFAHHSFWLHPRVEQQLDIERIPGVGRFEEWRIWLEENRPVPHFAPDELRQRAIQQIGESLRRDSGDYSSSVVWIFGPPGVGKTRLALESVTDLPSIEKRLFASKEFEYGKRAVDESKLPYQPNIVLVIDECPADQAPVLAASFLQKNGRAGGTLLLIGPQEGEVAAPGFRGTTLRVEPLDNTAARTLVNQELGGSPPEDPGLVERVLRLSEGFPWFAVLLAHALRIDPSALPADSNHWRAAELAIAGTIAEHGGERPRWISEVDHRARALMAVILTEGDDWSRLSQEQKQRLGRAVELDWSEVQRLAEECRLRGIIRVRQNWRYKYVTPNNLARMVANHFLTAPHFMGSQLRDHVPELVGTLYRRLEGLYVSDSLLHELAGDELEVLEQGSDPFEPTRHELHLQFVAHRQPARTARWLREVIESKSVDELRDTTEVRRDFVYALEHICHRRHGFEDAEASLFRLALGENENWSNNAMGVWTGLYFIALNLTHRSFDARLAILRDRTTHGPTESRLLGVSGLARAVSWEHSGPSYTSVDTIDGIWPRPTVPEVQADKEAAWQLLVKLIVDEDHSVAAKARQIAIDNLRSAIRWGIGVQVFERVASVVDDWDSTDQANLRERLNDIQRHERESLGRDRALKRAVESLEGQVKPTGFHGRLLDVVGRWFPGDQPIGAEDFDRYQAQLDAELAKEGLVPPVHLLDELEWLDSEEAVRVAPFMTHVGQLDNELFLLEPMIERARAGGATSTLSSYLAGVASAGMENDVDATLRSWRGQPELALHTFLTVIKIGPTDERVAWIIEDLQTKALNPNFTGYLAPGHWGTQASREAAKQLIETLAELPGMTPRITALDLIVERRYLAEELEDLSATLDKLLVDLAGVRLGGMEDHVWELAGRVALQRGSVESVVEAAVAAISSAEHYGSDDRGWNLMIAAAEAEPAKTWSALTPLLERDSSDFYRVLLEARRHQIVSMVPVQIILDWVGSDERRGLLVGGMCSAHEAPLNELARRLIIQFGATSSVAHELAAIAHSTPTAVNSLTGFANEQLTNAQQWAEDNEPSVAEWGALRLKEFEATFEAESAREEFEDRKRR